MIPEGLVDSIPELRLLISEIDGVFAECGNTHLENADLTSKLTMWSKALLDSLPDFMQSALLLSRGSDTHFQVITSLFFYHPIRTLFHRVIFDCHIALHGLNTRPVINLTINCLFCPTSRTRFCVLPEMCRTRTLYLSFDQLVSFTSIIASHTFL